MTKHTPTIERICQILAAKDGRQGIGKGLLEAISSLTPLVSVELIIRSADKQMTLLTWRQDELYGPGWHVPGGVVRFKEKLLDRVKRVLEDELGIRDAVTDGPMGSHEIFNAQRDKRGHFISFVFAVTLQSDPPQSKKANTEPHLAGQWRWFRSCPENFIKNQRVLKKYINNEY